MMRKNRNIGNKYQNISDQMSGDEMREKQKVKVGDGPLRRVTECQQNKVQQRCIKISANYEFEL